MTWYVADYLILTVSALAGIVGIFIGFSGALAFVAATVLGVMAGRFSWALSADFLSANWSRGLAVLVVSIIAFGLVRWGVKKCVNGLLKQPADAIYGFLLSALAGFVISSISVCLLDYFKIVDIQSTIVSEALKLV